jgi:hypothetical protein
MTQLDRYLNELFGFSYKNGKFSFLGVTAEYTSNEEQGYNICKELKDEAEEKINTDFKKCSTIPLGSKDRKICELIYVIKHSKDLLFDLKKNKFKCDKDSVCTGVINKKVFELNRDIIQLEKDLKELQKK